jgi:hypothetical protein
VHLETRSRILDSCFVNNRTLILSIEAVEYRLWSGHLQTHAIICYIHFSLCLLNGIPYERFHSHIVFLRSFRRLLVISNSVPSSPILVTLMIEVLRFSETSVLARATGRSIPEDGIFHSHRSENLRSYTPINNFVTCLVE